MQKQKGFTLIELVVVIVILGVLAAVALPRFMNATEDAHTSAVQGTGGALAAGVALAHSQWELNRGKGALNATNPNDNIVGFGTNDVDVSTTGWPVASDDSNAVDGQNDCVDLWAALLQGSAPSVNTAATDDYQSVAANNAGGQMVCTYTYRLDGRTAPNQRTIAYNTVTGVVATNAN